MREDIRELNALLARMKKERAEWMAEFDAVGEKRKVRPDVPPTMLVTLAVLDNGIQMIEAFMEEYADRTGPGPQGAMIEASVSILAEFLTDQLNQQMASLNVS